MAREWESIDYQNRALKAAFREWEGGTESILLCLPTGTGKTATAAMIAHHALEVHDRRSLFIVHRETLVNQAAETLSDYGLNVTVEMAAQKALELDAVDGKSEVVVGSVQTMQGQRLERWPRDRFGLVITDECHHARAASYSRIYKWFERFWHLGLTATPDRGDGKNLGSVFKTCCFTYPLKKAITDGWLVPVQVVECMVTIDLREIKTTGGDFNLGDLAERIGPKIEELCDAIKSRIEKRQTVVFTPDVGSAMCVAQVLRDMGVSSKYVAGSAGRFGLPKEERDTVLKEFADEAFQVIVSCELLFEGWDCPNASCAVILRPTRKRYRYAQMVGRVIRRCPQKGKTDCMVLDFDWEAGEGERDPCAAVDLFDDGSTDEAVLALAKTAVKAGKQKDVQKAIEEAEDEIRLRTKLQITLTGRKAQFKTLTYDPVGVGKILDIRLKRRWDMDPKGTNPATDGQLKYLQTLGVQYPTGISKWGASKLIEKLKKRKDMGLATVGQVKALLDLGVREDLARVMSADEARAAVRRFQGSRLF